MRDNGWDADRNDSNRRAVEGDTTLRFVNPSEIGGMYLESGTITYEHPIHVASGIAQPPLPELRLHTQTTGPTTYISSPLRVDATDMTWKETFIWMFQWCFIPLMILWSKISGRPVGIETVRQ